MSTLDACASNGETQDALRGAANALDSFRYQAERILAGARDGACDIHQALWATDLRREALSIAELLGAVEAATALALTGSAAREAA